jgi:tRNA (guanine-N7-)-methyltransferase
MNVPVEANPWVLNLSGTTPPLDWREVFDIPVQSVELEIGFGKGMFLRREAERRPNVGFLGVENAAKWLGICAKRLARDGRPNVRIVHADAFDMLARWIPEGSLSAVHVLFPDPWPKKRHAKRRLLAPALFDLAARGLTLDGDLVIATDVGWYFAEAMAELAGHRCYDRLPVTPEDEEPIRTNYAIKYARAGRDLHLARLARNQTASPPIPPPPSRRRRAASSAPRPASETR